MAPATSVALPRDSVAVSVVRWIVKSACEGTYLRSGEREDPGTAGEDDPTANER